jgi:hypothetical protein
MQQTTCTATHEIVQSQWIDQTASKPAYKLLHYACFCFRVLPSSFCLVQTPDSAGCLWKSIIEPLRWAAQTIEVSIVKDMRLSDLAFNSVNIPA